VLTCRRAQPKPCGRSASGHWSLLALGWERTLIRCGDVPAGAGSVGIRCVRGCEPGADWPEHRGAIAGARRTITGVDWSRLTPGLRPWWSETEASACGSVPERRSPAWESSRCTRDSGDGILPERLFVGARFQA